MKFGLRDAVLTVAVVLLVACGGDEEFVSVGECAHALSAAEEQSGWQLLYQDGDLSQWRGYQIEEAPAGWGSEGGCLTRLSSGGDLLSRGVYDNFELKLEWRISQAGNSGIFIRGDESGGSIAHTAMEMQVLDNDAHWDRFWDDHRAGAYYDMIVPPSDTTQPAGTWNKVHIRAQGPYIQFWLNGEKTADFRVGSEDWEKRFNDSKFSNRPSYGRLTTGHIALQDHWDKVWYRNIRVLRLPE